MPGDGLELVTPLVVSRVSRHVFGAVRRADPILGASSAPSPDLHVGLNGLLILE
jgi:hypothetical protein